MRVAASRFLSTAALTLIGFVALSAAEIERTEQMVAMRDGTKLATVVYRPANHAQPLPVVLARGPYGTFGEPLEVTGRIVARLFVSSDCPDTDFTVKLCEVYPDGRSMLVTDGILRARYRTSFREEEFLQ